MGKTMFFTGPPGSGKSTAHPAITRFLQDQGYSVSVMDDKRALMDQIAQEMEGIPVNALGQKEGEHSILLNPEAPWYNWAISFKDGHALNTAHEVLLRDVVRAQYEGGPNDIMVVEWAIGQNNLYYDKNGWDLEELTQSPAQFVTWMKAYGLDKAIVLDIHASLETRVKRNNERKEGHIPEKEFRTYFGDQPFTPEETEYLGSRYFRIVNEDKSEGQFLSEITGACESFILPHFSAERPASTNTPARR